MMEEFGEHYKCKNIPDIIKNVCVYQEFGTGGYRNAVIYVI